MRSLRLEIPMNKTEKALNPRDTAEKVIEVLNVRRCGGELLAYNSDRKVYESNEAWLRQWVASGPLLKDVRRLALLDEIMGWVKTLAPPIAPEGINDPRQRLVILQNGIYDVAAGELTSFHENHFYTFAIPHELDLRAECPNYDKWIEEMVPDADDRAFLDELMGYCLIPSTELQKAVILVGPTATGKSTWLELLRKLVGEQNCCFHPLSTLMVNRFAKADLTSKLVNICGDIDAQVMGLAGTAQFREWVSGAVGAVERKFQAHSAARFQARLVFSANALPTSKDPAVEAILRRLHLVSFDQKIQKADDSVGRAILGDVDGVLARHAIPGLHRLLESKEFTQSTKSKELLADYRASFNPLLTFTSRCLRWIAGGSQVDHPRTNSLYKTFSDYCKIELNIHAKAIPSRREFRLFLQENGFKISKMHGYDVVKDVVVELPSDFDIDDAA